MNRTKLIGYLVVAALLWLIQSRTAMSQPKAKPIAPVSYEELGKEIMKHRGKVVVVDCWFVGCLTCYDCMQHLTKLHDKHSGEGLVAITVCINITEEDWSKCEKDANEVLKKLGISTNNRLLKLSFDDASEKMQLPGGFPTVFVFNRQGKWRQFSGESVGKTMDRWIHHCLRNKN